MPLDTAPMLAALDPPAFRHEGVLFEGRHLSLLEWARYMERLAALGSRRMNLAEQQRLYRDLVDAWFPPPRRRWLSRRPRSAADVVLSLPPLVQDQLLSGFITSQHRALGLESVSNAGSIEGTTPTT